jgi:4-amino-4-deoxy-L-arabinose transferase-like glycosyltransferase
MGGFLAGAAFLGMLLLLLWSPRLQNFLYGTTFQRPFTRREQLQFWSVAAVLLLAFILRLHTVWEWNFYRPDRLIGDEPGYDSLARGMLEGYGFTWAGRVPLYPLWLAFVYLLTNGRIPPVRWGQLGWSLLVVVLVYVLARRLFGHRGGLLAAFLAAISYLLSHQAVRLLSESLYTPVLLLAAIALWDAFQEPKAARFAWAGVLVGVSNLIRPTMFLFPLFLAVILLAAYGWRRGLRWAAAFILTSTLVITPWMVRNYLVYQAVYPLATSNAFLWQGSPEYYHLVKHEGYTYLDVWEKVIYGPDGQLHDPGSVEGDRWWTQRALRSIAAEPLVYLVFVLEKSVTYWIGDPNADWNDTYIFNYQALRDYGFSHYVAIQYMLARILPFFAVLAAAALWRWRRQLLPVYILLVYFTLLHAVGHAEARLSEPLQPFLLILIAGALEVHVLPRLRLGERFGALLPTPGEEYL